MKLEEDLLKEDDYVLNYLVYRGGSKYLLAFHGFGQNASTYASLAEQLKNEYTIISIDIFFHGKSHWPIDKTLTKNKWKKVVQTILSKHKIDRFDITGFSMGGKFALATIETFANKIDRSILIAPDGIKTSMWYNLATYPLFFQNIFKSMIVKPKRFYDLTDLLKKFNLVDKSILKFAASQMNSTKKRRRVYYSWIIFKEFDFDLKKLANIINKNDIQVTMVLGTHDKIITKEGMLQLLKHVENHKVKMINSGHNDLINAFSKEL